MLAAGLLAVPLLALLLGLGVLFGERSSLKSDTLGGALAVTITQPFVAAVLALLLVGCLGAAVRRVVLAYQVWRPGAIVVQTFTAASELTGTSETQLTAMFRERLVLLRLQAAAPSPGAAQEGAVLDVLGGSTQATDVFGVLAKIAHGAMPSHALEVEGVIRQREREPKCGVTVQVSQRPSQASPVVEVWESSWERAARTAADGATAATLPRTRLCVGPWAAWRGYRLPPEVLTAYEDASEFEQERRFDEALSEYWHALRLDPGNLTIRLHLAQLQEKAGLYVGALANYQRILALASPGGRALPRGIYRRRARREWDRAVQLAKYRAIVLLGQGTVARQWSATTSSAEVADPDRLRKEFRVLLRPLVQPPRRDTPRRDPATEEISEAVREILALHPGQQDEIAQVEQTLSRIAYRAANELKLSLSRTERRPTRRPISRRTVALTQLCLEVRAMRREEKRIDDGTLKALDRAVSWAGWRPGPWAGWWPSWLRRWQWHENYNAACAFALSLDASDDDAGSSPRVERAIRRLERALATREDRFVVNWRDWVLREDPDLERLRPTEAFRALTATYFPRKGPPATPSAGLSQDQWHRFAESRYTRDLLVALADRLHDTWHARVKETGDVHAWLDWSEEERETWRLVLDLAERPYDWRFRQQLLEYANAHPPGVAPVEVAFAGYDDPLLEPEKLSNEMIDGLQAVADYRIKKLQGHSGLSSDQAPLPWLPARSAMHGREVKRRANRELCEHHATVWQRLAEWLTVEDRFATDESASSARWHAMEGASREFSAGVDEAAAAWSAAMAEDETASSSRLHARILRDRVPGPPFLP
jgi:tetratricopeptide (TPR) repeat protein